MSMYPIPILIVSQSRRKAIQVVERKPNGRPGRLIWIPRSCIVDIGDCLHGGERDMVIWTKGSFAREHEQEDFLREYYPKQETPR